MTVLESQNYFVVGIHGLIWTRVIFSIHSNAGLERVESASLPSLQAASPLQKDIPDSSPLKIRDGPGSPVNKPKAALSFLLYQRIIPIIILIAIEVIPSLFLSVKENLSFSILSSNVMAQEEKETEISRLVGDLGRENEAIRLSAADALRSRIDGLIKKMGGDYNAIFELEQINIALIKALGNANEHVRYHADDIFGKTIENA